MPKILKCRKYMKNGYKYGKYGYCHLYTERDESTRVKALQKAIKDRDEAERNKKYSLGDLIQTLFN